MARKKIKVKKDVLFDLSIDRNVGYNYTDLLVKRIDYKTLVTFVKNKREPIYNWFYYKEGFSRELVWNLFLELGVDKLNKKKEDTYILDPFSGTGNTLLASKQFGFNATGLEVLPLGFFVANTKLQDDYDLNLLCKEIRKLTLLKFGKTNLTWPNIGFINIKHAFSRYARNDLLFFKEKILDIEDEKIRNFCLLSLLSITGEVSNMKKDGGVLRHVKKKHLPPVRYLLKNRLKRMYKDIKKENPKKNYKIKVKAILADSCGSKLGLEKNKFDFCITSPPYLNFVDYSKLYSLELALLVDSSDEIITSRNKSVKSFIGEKNKRNESKRVKIKSEILDYTLSKVTNYPEVIKGYFLDMYLSLKNIHKFLKPGSKCAIVIGNTSLPELTIDCDLILTEIAESIGFSAREIMVANVRWATIYRIKKEKPVRESIVILEKKI